MSNTTDEHRERYRELIEDERYSLRAKAAADQAYDDKQEQLEWLHGIGLFNSRADAVFDVLDGLDAEQLDILGDAVWAFGKRKALL